MSARVNYPFGVRGYQVAAVQALCEGVEGLAFAPMEAPAAAGVLGPAAHREVAAQLAPVIERLLK